MKRLTIRSGFTGETYLTGEADVCWANRPIEERAFCTGCHRHKGKDRANCGALVLIDRLAAIEDILCDGTDEYDLDRLSVLCNQRMTMREEVSQRFSLTAKIPLDRLRELAEADREGRCVVLPCKRDDVLWTFQTYPSERVYSFHVTDLSTLNGRTMLNTDIMGVVDARDVGKTVFLTRAEAEAALAKLNSET